MAPVITSSVVGNVSERTIDESRQRLLDEYGAWLAAAPLNLVSRADRGRVSTLHIPESALIAQRLSLHTGARVVDLGSGGGLPGVAVAICHPNAKMLCVDARRKKMAWVQTTCDELGIDNVMAEAGRAEVLARRPDLRATADAVVSRALSTVLVVAELARGFLTSSGELVVVKGSDPSEEVAQARRWASRLGYAAPRVESLEGAPRPTTLVRMRAEGVPPAWVPRSDGTPQREPLAGERSDDGQDDVPR